VRGNNRRTAPAPGPLPPLRRIAASIPLITDAAVLQAISEPHCEPNLVEVNVALAELGER